jgi:hypothetical protein
VAHGIATGFLQIHPSDVSASILQKDSDGNWTSRVLDPTLMEESASFV